MSHDEIAAIRKLLTSKPRPVGWEERRARLDEVGSAWSVAADIKLESVDCGGVRGGWGNLLAVVPGGATTPLIPADQIIDATLDFDTMKSLDSALGTAGVIVLDRSTDLVRAIARIARFYMHESCGQCTPCREGAGWVWRVLSRMTDGRADASEIDILLDVTQRIEGHTICALGDSVAWPVQGLIRHFRGEIERRIDKYTGRTASRHSHRS